MAKVFYGVITIVVVACFCGLVPSAANDITEMVKGTGTQR